MGTFSDPGANGTSGTAVNGTRMPGTFTAAAAGTTANSNTIEWVSVPASETYTWDSLWNHAPAGTFLGKDDLSTPAPVTTGDTMRIAAGELDLVVGD
jgi:hypothetical protein